MKSPLLEIDPALADQVTAVFAVPLILAVNCSCCIAATVAFSGVSETKVEGEFAEFVFAVCDKVPHAVVRPARQSNSDRIRISRIRFLSPRLHFADSRCRASHIKTTSGRSWGTEVRVRTTTLDKKKLKRQMTQEHGLSGHTSASQVHVRPGSE